MGLEGERGAMFSDIQALVTYYRSGVRKQRVITHDRIYRGHDLPNTEGVTLR